MLLFLVVLASCSGSSHIPTAAIQQQGDYQVAFASGNRILIRGAQLSLKHSSDGNAWFSFDFKGGEVQHLTTAVSSLRQVTLNGLEGVPVGQLVTKQSPFTKGLETMCSGTPLIAQHNPMCSGGSDCTVMDGNCVNTNGDCINSDPCGATTSSGGWGIGTGVIGFHDGFLCEIDFAGETMDCYSDSTGPTYTDADLFLSWRAGVTSWTVTCSNPQSSGWATAHYRDTVSNGGAFQFIHAAPGTNQWLYPTMFPSITGTQYPYSPPIDFSSSYYVLGGFLHLFPERDGHCNYAGN